jgi:hypothetical protein
VGISAASTAFEAAGAAAQAGAKAGMEAASISAQGAIAAPGVFISEMAKAGGHLGAILKQIQNPALQIAKHVQEFAKNLQQEAMEGRKERWETLQDAQKKIFELTRDVLNSNQALGDLVTKMTGQRIKV